MQKLLTGTITQIFFLQPGLEAKKVEKHWFRQAALLTYIVHIFWSGFGLETIFATLSATSKNNTRLNNGLLRFKYYII